MADVVKSGRSRAAQFQKEDRVSVPRDFFDNETYKYLETVPEKYAKICGTVQFVFSISSRVNVTWDLDGTTSTVKFSDVSKEAQDCEIQLLEEKLLVKSMIFLVPHLV